MAWETDRIEAVAAAMGQQAARIAGAIAHATFPVADENARLEPCEAADLEANLHGAGILITLETGGTGVVVLVPLTDGEPDQSRLDALANELAGLFPEAWRPERAAARSVDSLSHAVSTLNPGSDCRRFNLPLTFVDKPLGVAYVLFPVDITRLANDDGGAHSHVQSAVAQRRVDLPSYMLSLLQVEVPVSVTLASKKQSLRQIVEIGVGSIIDFDKPCDSMLTLEVNGRPIGQGEAVKVGDKFGIRLAGLWRPEERFHAVQAE